MVYIHIDTDGCVNYRNAEKYTDSIQVILNCLNEYDFDKSFTLEDLNEYLEFIERYPDAEYRGENFVGIRRFRGKKYNITLNSDFFHDIPIVITRLHER